MTHDEMIEVIAAHRDGKRIEYSRKEYRKSENRIWVEAKTPVWDFDCYDYRVMPEPVEAWAIVDGYNKVVSAFKAKELAESAAINYKNVRVARLVEKSENE